MCPFRYANVSPRVDVLQVGSPCSILFTIRLFSCFVQRRFFVYSTISSYNYRSPPPLVTTRVKEVCKPFPAFVEEDLIKCTTQWLVN